MALELEDIIVSDMTRIEYDVRLVIKDEKTGATYIVRVECWRFPEDYELREVNIKEITIAKGNDKRTYTLKDFKDLPNFLEIVAFVRDKIENYLEI